MNAPTRMVYRSTEVFANSQLGKPNALGNAMSIWLKKRKDICMIPINDPLFLENEEWYYYDSNDHCYKLTDKAPKEAIESYKEFYKQINNLRK